MLANANIDAFLAGWFHDHLSPAFVMFLQVLSGPGSEYCILSLVVLTVLGLAWRRSWSALLMLFITVPGGALMGELLKSLVQRHRPFVSGPFGEWGGYSFPSGHTIAATLLYGFLALLFADAIRRHHPGRWHWLPFFISAVLIAAVGFSRVALGAHYFTDVLAAMILGSLWIATCTTSLSLLRRLKASPASAPSSN